MIEKYNLHLGPMTLLALAITTHSAHAATERQLDAHEHGHAQLNMAVSGNEVLAELISPAANIVGFEYAPKTEEEKDSVVAATQALSGGEQLFIFDSSAECSLLAAEVESELLVEDHDDHDHDSEEKHDEHDHDSEEKHDDHDHDSEEKHDDHDHDAHSDETHSEFHVTWSFSCAHPEKLSSVQVNLFEVFPGFEEIDASVATESGQSSVELSADQAAIAL